jgi:hypothetical protein
MRRPRYKLPGKLEQDLRRLYGDIAFESFIYGDTTWPEEWRSKAPPSSVSLEVRGRVLVEKLEGYLQDMVEFAAELDDPLQTDRLRSEATGILLALREMTSYLPEIIARQPPN